MTSSRETNPVPLRLLVIDLTVEWEKIARRFELNFRGEVVMRSCGIRPIAVENPHRLHTVRPSL